jgi:hypothetical protein
MVSKAIAEIAANKSVTNIQFQFTMKNYLFSSKKSLHKIAKSGLITTILLLFLVVLMPTAKSDCGAMGSRAAERISFVHLDLLAWQSDYAPYLMGYHVIENYYMMNRREAQENDNIGEWRGRFCDITDSADVDALLFDSELEELADLREAASKKGRDNDYILKDNKFAQVLQQNRCVETIDYLIFAKTCEPYCVKGDKWSATKPLNADMAGLIGRGNTEFRRTKSPFLRMRYFYQMLRLAHYAKDYAQVLRIWDELLPKIQRTQTIINYWALAHKAGALRALGRRAEAAYLFAVVFRYCPSKRKQAFESFDIKTEQEWQECLTFCKNGQERAALYAIRASYNNARALDDMYELYKLDPKNEHLDMLLIRETLRLEKIVLSNDFRRGRLDRATMLKTMDYMARLRQFVGTVANQGLVTKPSLWRTTEGYLALLGGDVRGCLATLYKAEKLTPQSDILILEQIENYTLAARIIGLQKSDVQVDSVLTALRNSNAYASDEDFEKLLYEKLGTIYRQRGENGAAFLCEYSIGEMEKNPNLALLDELIGLARKPNKTLFEKELTTRGDSMTIESDIWDLKGRFHLSHFQFEAAADAFSHISDPRKQAKNYSPFSDNIIDCVNCSRSDTVGLMNRQTFTRTMLDLEFSSKAALDKAAPFYYKLGLGYYNMTFFGNSSGLADAYRSGTTWNRINQGKNVFPVKNNPFGNVELLDCAIALNYFEKARQLFWNTDREMSAKAAFWAAKCQQNLYFISVENRYRTGSRLMPDLPPSYKSYFELLKNNYGDTKYFGEARTKCKYFDFYVRR